MLATPSRQVTVFLYVCVSACAGSQGRRGEQAQCFSNLGVAFSQLGEEEEAAESFVLALQGFRDSGDVTSSPHCLCMCVCVCVH